MMEPGRKGQVISKRKATHPRQQAELLDERVHDDGKKEGGQGAALPNTTLEVDPDAGGAGAEHWGDPGVKIEPKNEGAQPGWEPYFFQNSMQERNRNTVKGFTGVNTKDKGVTPGGEPSRPSIELGGELLYVLATQPTRDETFLLRVKVAF